MFRENLPKPWCVHVSAKGQAWSDNAQQNHCRTHLSAIQSITKLSHGKGHFRHQKLTRTYIANKTQEESASTYELMAQKLLLQLAKGLAMTEIASAIGISIAKTTCTFGTTCRTRVCPYCIVIAHRKPTRNPPVPCALGRLFIGAPQSSSR